MKKIQLAILALVLCGAVPLHAQTVPSATLSWTANTESDLAGYKLYRGLFPCPTTGGLPSPAYKDVGKVTTYTDTLPVGTTDVCYDITAYDLSGNESAQSLKVSKSFATLPAPTPTPAPAPTPVPAPTIVPPTGFAYANGLLTWSAVPGASGYLLRVHELSMPYLPCAAPNFAICNQVADKTIGTSLTLTLKPGTAYDAWIHSVDANGVVGDPTGISFATPAPDITPPAVPSGLQITSATSDQIVIVASATDCRRVITNTTGSTSAQSIRTLRCVR